MKFNQLNLRAHQIRQALTKNGLTILSGIASPSDTELTEFASLLSLQKDEKLLNWSFGPVMKMKFDAKARNYLFSSETVPLHWDGAFFKVPHYLLFYCDNSEGEGGETFFVNTTKVYEDLNIEEIEQYRRVSLAYKTEKLSHYGGEFSTPLLDRHPETHRPVIRFAEKVDTELNPVNLTITNAPSGDFYQEFKNKLYQSRHSYYHRWKPGDLVIVDNYTYLHGRKALQGNLKREFRRVQIL
jgi:alpha-ketoglutarate-dependent taurine dioxygenase